MHAKLLFLQKVAPYFHIPLHSKAEKQSRMLSFCNIFDLWTSRTRKIAWCPPIFNIFYNEQLKKIQRPFFENPEKDFTLNVFLLLEFKCLWKMGISCSNISISIKTFPKHTFQRQIASLLLLCKQGNVFCLFFQEQLNKTK